MVINGTKTIKHYNGEFTLYYSVDDKDIPWDKVEETFTRLAIVKEDKYTRDYIDSPAEEINDARIQFRNIKKGSVMINYEIRDTKDPSLHYFFYTSIQDGELSSCMGKAFFDNHTTDVGMSYEEGTGFSITSRFESIEDYGKNYDEEFIRNNLKSIINLDIEKEINSNFALSYLTKMYRQIFFKDPDFGNDLISVPIKNAFKLLEEKYKVRLIGRNTKTNEQITFVANDGDSKYLNRNIKKIHSYDLYKFEKYGEVTEPIDDDIALDIKSIYEKETIGDVLDKTGKQIVKELTDD